MSKEIVYLSPDELKPDPNQPRKRITEEMIDDLAATMASQGVINPIEIDEKNMIVTGELRWRAAVKAGFDKVPCTRWEDGKAARLERQTVENLHHYELTSVEKENAIYRLWETGKYKSMAELARTLGYNETSIWHIIRAKEFRDKHKNLVTDEISTGSIRATLPLKENQRVKILQKLSEKKIEPKELPALRKAAQASDDLLDKALEKKISLDRVEQTAETIKEIDEKLKERDVELTEEQKKKFVLEVAKDEQLLDKYKAEIHRKVTRLMTRKEAPKQPTEPIGRKSPVYKMSQIKDIICNNWRKLIRLMDYKERLRAKKVLIKIRDEVEQLIYLMPEE